MAQHCWKDSFRRSRCALLLTLAAICRLAGGFLSWRGGTNPFKAALYGFGACGVAAGLGIAFFTLLV
ncbi:hypothetical protein [Nocardia arizonensis]|uniref:hypothetical protein n=1 Tax=Nocardia arizonensis TaxID=1141647 RepID=UPI0006D09E8F|nr:hypothetical protein [Nocardia arizonensis]